MNSDFYLKQQQLLAASKGYRWFWQGWGLYGVLVYFVLAVIFLFQPQGWKIIFLAVLAGLVTRYAVCGLFVVFYKKPHPYQSLKFDPPTSWLFSFQDNKFDAFPSQHSATTAAIAAAFWQFNPLWGVVAMAAALVIGIGRIIIGYHDLRDVLAGLLIGSASGLIIAHLLYSWLFTR